MKTIFGFLAIGLTLVVGLLTPEMQQTPQPTPPATQQTTAQTPSETPPPSPTVGFLPPATPEMATHLNLPGKFAFILETNVKQGSYNSIYVVNADGSASTHVSTSRISGFGNGAMQSQFNITDVALSPNSQYMAITEGYYATFVVKYPLSTDDPTFFVTAQG